MLPKQTWGKKAKTARHGQALVEYITIVAAVAMTSLVAVSVFGRKVAQQYAIGAGMLPGAHAEDNAPITIGEFAGFAEDPVTGALTATGEVGWGSITGNTTPGEMENNILASGSNGACVFVCEGGGAEDDDGGLIPVGPPVEEETPN